MESKSHFLAHFIPGILLGSVVGMAFGSLLVATQIPSVVSTGSSSITSTGFEPRTLLVGDLTLQYPDGWHVYGENTTDDANRILPGHSALISPDPIQLNSPSEATGVPISVYFADESEAILAPYESDVYAEYLTDEIYINGQKVIRLRLTAAADTLYPPYQEVLFIGGYEVKYNYTMPSEANDPNWLLVKNSLSLSTVQAAEVPDSAVTEKSCITRGNHDECLTLKRGDILPVGAGYITGKYLGMQTLDDAWVSGKTVSCPVFEIDGGSQLIIDGLKRLVAAGSGVVPMKDGKFLWRMGTELPKSMIGTIETAAKVYVTVPSQPEAGVANCYSPFVPVSVTDML